MSLGLIQEKDGSKDITKHWRNDTLTRYVYVGPSINVAAESCDDMMFYSEDVNSIGLKCRKELFNI